MQRNSSVFKKVLEFFFNEMQQGLAQLAQKFEEQGFDSDETEKLF